MSKAVLVGLLMLAAGSLAACGQSAPTHANDSGWIPSPIPSGCVTTEINGQTGLHCEPGSTWHPPVPTACATVLDEGTGEYHEDCPPRDGEISDEQLVEGG